MHNAIDLKLSGATFWTGQHGHSTILKVLSTVAVILVTLLLLLFVIRRIYFHPLRHIPGPKLAAASRLYGFYYNMFQHGYTKRFPDLHKRYASAVVRIGPNHVHVNEPEFYQTMFGPGTEYRKEPEFYEALDGKGALLSITDDQEYRPYRTHMSPLFSVRFADCLGPILISELDRLSKFLARRITPRTPVDIQAVYRAFVADIGCRALLGHDLDFMEFNEQGTRFLASAKEFQKASWLAIQFPTLMRLLNYLPDPINAIIAPDLLWFSRHCEAWQKKAQDARALGIQPDPKRFFDLCLDVNSSSNEKIRNIVHPINDAYNLLAAGMDTTSYTLSCATFYLLESPSCVTRLQKELDEASVLSPEAVDLKKIQNLPYLSAVVKETLRISHGTPGYLPRVVPKGGADVGHIFIPEGTSVTVTHPVVQLDPTIFPKPNRFRPERWLEGKSNLDRWHIGFGKGPRKCIGMNIANVQLHCCLAYIFSRYELELFDTTRESLQWSDYIVAQTAAPVKVKIRRDRWA